MLFFSTIKWKDDLRTHQTIVPLSHSYRGWDKDQKIWDQNLRNFARYYITYLNNISVIIYPASRGSQWICSHARSLRHPWRCKRTPEATNQSIFWIRERKKTGHLTGDASLVYHPHAEVPSSTAPEDGSTAMAVWWPGLVAAPPALHHCSCVTPPIQTGLSSLPCTMFKHWSPPRSQHWHIWKSLGCDSGLPLKAFPWL